MSLVNQFYMNLDIKRRFERYVATFRSGDNVELIMSIFDDGKEYDISQATSATIYQKTCSGISLKGEGTFDTIDGKRVIRYTLEKLYTIENGFNTMILVIGDGTKEVSVQPFNVYINNDLTAKSGSYIDLIQDIMLQIEDLTFKLENTIKNEEKGVPNGVALSDEKNEVPMDIIPLKFKSFLDHIPQTVYEHQVHGMRVNMDGMLQHDTGMGNWVDTVVNTKYENEGSDTGYLKVDISIKDDVITLKYTGGPKVELQKWASGERGNSYFKSNGNSFTGLTFNVPQNGDYTLWYTDNNGNEYTKLFKVGDVEEPINVDIDVVDGIVTVITDADVMIKKWATGNRDIAYFQNNGTEFTGNTFEVQIVGTYTIYLKEVNGKEYVYVFEVTEEQLAPPEVIINVNEGVVTVDTNLDVSIKKWAVGERDIAYFQTEGNVFTDSFEIGNLSKYTIYIKTTDGRESVHVFELTHENSKKYFTVEVENGIATITYLQPVMESETMWAKGLQDEDYFINEGTLVVDNKFKVTEIGDYTVKVVLDPSRIIRVGAFTVTEEQLEKDTTPPDLYVSYSGLSNVYKVGAVIATIIVTDNQSGLAKLIYPDGTEITENIPRVTQYTFNNNGTYKFTAYDNAGNMSEKSITINNITNPTVISTMPIGTRFSFIQGEYVLLEKNGDRNVIAEYEASNQFRERFDYDGLTNKFPESSIKHFLNIQPRYDTLDGQNEIIEDAQWNYGPLVVSNGTIKTDMYDTSITGLLTAPQLKEAYTKGYIIMTGTSNQYEWSINYNDVVPNEVYVVGDELKNNSPMTFGADISNPNGYRRAYQVTNNAVGYL